MGRSPPTDRADVLCRLWFKDAKKEFVEANKQVKNSSDDSNSNLGDSSENSKKPKRTKKINILNIKKFLKMNFSLILMII